ncbi:MAG: hypothetical protein LKI24_03350 [Acidipropionibacterium sp.]|jgi:hypothetical protein|nr:hypothetical protein [Acidipropionibacterium sp.]
MNRDQLARRLRVEAAAFADVGDLEWVDECIDVGEPGLAVDECLAILIDNHRFLDDALIDAIRMAGRADQADKLVMFATA